MLHTEVSVEQVELGLLGHVLIKNVQLQDQKGRPMLSLEKAILRMDVTSLFKEKKIIRSMGFFGGKIQLIKDEKDGPYNFQFLVDLLSKDKDEEAPPVIFSLRNLRLKDFTVIHEDKAEPLKRKGIDIHHVRIDKFCSNMRMDRLSGDSIFLRVRSMRCGVSHGFDLKSLSFTLSAGKRSALLSDLQMKVNGSTLAVPVLIAYYDKPFDFRHCSLSAREMTASLIPSDGAFLLPQLRRMSERVTLKTSISFSQRNLSVRNLRFFQGRDVSLGGEGGYSFLTKDAHVKISRLSVRKGYYEKLCPLLGDSASNISHWMEKFGDFEANASFFRKGKNSNFSISARSGIGPFGIKGNLKNRILHLTGESVGLDLGVLLEREEDAGAVPFSIQAEASLNERNEIDKARGNVLIKKGEIKQYKWDECALSACYEREKRKISFLANVSDPCARAKVEGSYSFSPRRIGATCRIHYLVPDRIVKISENGLPPLSANVSFHVNLNGKLPAGECDVEDLVFYLPKENYCLPHISASIDHNSITAIAPGLALNVKGQYSIDDIMESFYRIAERNIFGQRERSVKKNDFSFSLQLSSTQFLEKILKQDIHSEGPTSVSGYLSDKDDALLLTCAIPSLRVAGQELRNITLYGDVKDGRANILLQLLRGSEKSGVSLVAHAYAKDSLLNSSIEWKDVSSEKYSGQLLCETAVSKDKKINTRVFPSTIIIEDSLWSVSPATFSIKGKNVEIDHFKLSNKDKYLALDGRMSSNAEDVLHVTLNGLNLEYIFDLLSFHPVDFSGEASGSAQVCNLLSDPSLTARLHIHPFCFNGGYMGDMDLLGSWKDKEVGLRALITDSLKHTTGINGKVSVGNDSLDLHFLSSGTNMEFLNSFLPETFSHVRGEYWGSCRLFGPFNKLNIVGDGRTSVGMHVEPLGIDFKILDDSIHLRRNRVEFPSLHVADGNGHVSILDGLIHHEHLGNFRYDFKIKAKNMLMMNTSQYDGDTYWGKVYASGDVHLWGYPGSFNANLSVRPEEGSDIYYNADLEENSQDEGVIEFRDKNAIKIEESTSDSLTSKEPEEKETDVRMNIEAEMNPSLSVHIIMDAASGNMLSCGGNGRLRASYHNKGGFDLYGTYELDHGTYRMTVQDIIQRDFLFNKGGRVIFSGNPFDGDLSMQAVHTINSASLSDLNFGETFSNKNVKVNCILSFAGKVGVPEIHFGMDIPGISEDEKRMIYSLISTEEDMNLQVAYLLSVGRFYAYDYSNYSGTQSQGSMAMNSILSGTLSNRLSEILSGVFQNKHWALGTNLQTGSDGWSDMEVDGTLTGKFLSGRLLFNGSMGYKERQLSGTQNFIGDFNLEYLLTPNGEVRLKAYSQQNDRYFTKSTLSTQGGGILLQKSFDKVGDLFKGPFFRWKRRGLEPLEKARPK